MSTIVVPLDGSDFCEIALPVARAVARRLAADLRLIRVAPKDIGACDRYLEDVAAQIADTPVSTHVVTAIEGDRVADGIKRAVGELPDAVVCMSAHGRSGVGAALLGTTTEEVLHALHQPVLVVGRHCSATWPNQNRIIVPLDGSYRAEHILPFTAELVRTWDLEPWVVQVLHPLDTEAATHARDGMERARARLHELGVEARPSLQFDEDVAASIAGQARDLGASLIIMSSYVAPGLARTLFGSVTMRVIHQAPCPVLVCPPDRLYGRVVRGDGCGPSGAGRAGR